MLSVVFRRLFEYSAEGKEAVASQIGLRYMARFKNVRFGGTRAPMRATPGHARLIEEAGPCPQDIRKFRIFGDWFHCLRA